MKTSEKNFITYAGIGAIAIFIASRLAEKFMITAEDKKNFKRTMLPITASIEKDFGIKPNILIAQAALESKYGVSGLTVSANNLFGFTGESWAKLNKPVIYMDTREYINGAWTVVKRPFRKYNSWYDSAKDWATTISGMSRYVNALIYAKTGDLAKFASEIKAAGYATDPNYPQLLIARGVEMDAIKVEQPVSGTYPGDCKNYQKEV